ncbi:MAG: efflux RND transporter permease subunit, partial [Flavobacteriales bacterium]
MFKKIIHRPVLAIVISVIITFLGILSINTLPKSQFPTVAPPTVHIFVSYPGATANQITKSTL